MLQANSHLLMAVLRSPQEFLKLARSQQSTLEVPPNFPLLQMVTRPINYKQVATAHLVNFYSSWAVVLNITHCS